MVIGLLAVTAIPTVTGVGQAVSAQKRQNEAAKDQVKFGLRSVLLSEEGRPEERGSGVLVDGKLFLNLPEDPVQGYSFNGWYFTYPSEEGHKGLVSMVSDDPPALNWIFVNKDTHAVEYGARKATIGHVIGPWGWTADERFLTLQGRVDDFIALRDGEGRWGVFWDPDGKLLEAAGEDNCQPLRLRRQMALGIESRYVKD